MWNWFKPSTPKAGGATSTLAETTSAEPLRGIDRLKSALNRTRQALLGSLWTSDSEAWLLEEAGLEELEENLIRADLGVGTASALVHELRSNPQIMKDQALMQGFLREKLSAMLTLKAPGSNALSNSLAFNPDVLNIYWMVGVNGSGKTTSIGKLAYQFTQQGYRVVIGAGDTFRAAAEDQLAIWAQRAGAQLVAKPGGDPAAVVYQAIEEAKRTQAQVVILDTAGRLQNKYHLMEELVKIANVIEKQRPESSIKESLLVLDATTGQNALNQAEAFLEAAQLTGVILTKLDGSAKGGIVFNLAAQYQLPVKLVGLGEKIDDLEAFDPQQFLEALF